MTTTKQMTEALQAHDLNIVDALAIIGSTIQSLKSVQGKQAEMDALIEAGISYKKNGRCRSQVIWKKASRQM